MDDLVAVHVVHGEEQLGGDHARIVLGQRALLTDGVAESAAIAVLKDHLDCALGLEHFEYLSESLARGELSLESNLVNQLLNSIWLHQ